MFDVNERRMLYYGLIHLLLSYGIVCGQMPGYYVEGYLPFKKGYKVQCRVKEIETMQGQFQASKDINVILVIIQETILYANEKYNYTVNKQLHTCNARDSNDCHRYVHNLKLYKPLVAGFLFCNKLPNNIEHR